MAMNASNKHSQIAKPFLSFGTGFKLLAADTERGRWGMPSQGELSELKLLSRWIPPPHAHLGCTNSDAKEEIKVGWMRSCL